MKRSLTAALFFALLGLSACISLGATPASAPKEQLPSVLIIGDSISYGYTPHVTEMLKGQAVVKHCPANAGPTMRGVENIEKWLGKTKWDVILFNFGLWDMYGWRYEKIDRSPPAYEKRLDALATRLKKTGARLIWATTTPACPEPEKKCKVKVAPATERKYLEAAGRVMKKHKIAVCDLHAFMKPKLKQYAIAPNDVHFKKDGKRALGKQVANRIKAMLAGPAGGEWISLFNGKDLTGWQGDPGIWRVKDGVIEGVGACTDHKGYKSYLINRSHILKDFILEVEFNMARGNSGVNYRCHDYDKDKKKLYEVSGYQADIAGLGLWDIYTTSDSKRYSVKKASGRRAKSNQWHTLRIEAVGNKLTHTLDGVKRMEFTDTDTKGGFREKGFVALEFHDNRTQIKFRNIRVKTLNPAAGKKKETIVGAWTVAVDAAGKLVMNFTFKADGSVEVVFRDEVVKGTYQADYSKKPAHLDLRFTDKEKVETIFQFPESGRLQLENNQPGRPRPKAFTKGSLVFSIAGKKPKSARLIVTKQGAIVGTWTGSSKMDESIVMTFKADGAIRASVGDETLEGTYQADHSKTPHHLDIKFADKEKVETIFQLLDSGQLQLEGNHPGGARPKAFTVKSVLLSKKK